VVELGTKQGRCCAENSGQMMLADGIEYPAAGVFFAG
jgi:hypothetical protein